MSEENPARFNEGECENMNEIDQPYRMDSLPESLTDITDVRGQFSNESDLSDVNTELNIAGRVTRINEFGDFVFYDVQDSTGEIQVMCSIDDRSEFETDNYTDLVGAISTGDHIVVSGCPDISDTGELTINANTLSVSSKSLRSISTEWNQLDEQNQIENRTAALVSNSDLFETVQTRFEIQNEIRHMLDRQGYMEVETPILQGQAGGANAAPFQAFCEDLNRDLYLRIAPELYLKRLIVSGYTQIYEMSRCFRNESIDTTHNPEFTMLELYEQYADYTDMMDLFETICEQTAESVLGRTDVEYDGYSVDLSSWNRIAFDSYVADTLGYDNIESVTDQELVSYLEDSNRSVENLQELHTDELLLEVFECIESDIREPTIIYDFPRISTPLCQTHPTKQDRVERFEAFVMGMEVANAYSELTNPVEQLQRLTDQVGEDDIDSLNTNFVEALSYGMPPTGGLGVGIERLSMILTDSQSIKEVIPYPLTANRV